MDALLSQIKRGDSCSCTSSLSDYNVANQRCVKCSTDVLQEQFSEGLIDRTNQCAESSSTNVNTLVQVKLTTRDVNNIDTSSASCNNLCSCLRVKTVDGITDGREDTSNSIEVQSGNRHDVETDVSVNNLRVGSRRFREYDLITNNLIGSTRCLNHTIESDKELIILNNYLFAFYLERECLLNAVKLSRDIINLLNDRSQNFLRVGQSLLTEENFGVVEGRVDRLCSTEGGDLVDVGVLVDVHLFGEVSSNLTSRDILTTSQFKLTEHVETNRVVVLQDLILPSVDGNLRLNNVGEVLIEVGVLDLLNNLRRFTNIISKSTSSSSDSINIQHALSDVDIVDNTRCTRNNTLYLTTDNKVAVRVSNFQDLRLNLPTIVLRNKTESSCSFICLTLEYFFTFQESGSFNHSSRFTTEHLGKQYLTTITLSQESNKVTRLSVNRGQCKTELISFKSIDLTSNSVVSSGRGQTGQTNATRFRQNTNSRTNILSTELNLSTSGNTMREVELQIVQVEVHNIGELRFQSHNWL